MVFWCFEDRFVLDVLSFLDGFLVLATSIFRRCVQLPGWFFGALWNRFSDLAGRAGVEQ